MSDVGTLETEYAQLLLAKEQNDRDIADIQSQLYEARSRHAATGAYADPGWYGRAMFAAKRHGQRSQSMQRRLGELRREIKRAAAFAQDQLFIKAARATLDPDTFARVLAVADQLATSGAV